MTATAPQLSSPASRVTVPKLEGSGSAVAVATGPAPLRVTAVRTPDLPFHSAAFAVEAVDPHRALLLVLGAHRQVDGRARDHKRVRAVLVAVERRDGRDVGERQDRRRRLRLALGVAQRAAHAVDAEVAAPPLLRDRLLLVVPLRQPALERRPVGRRRRLGRRAAARRLVVLLAPAERRARTIFEAARLGPAGGVQLVVVERAARTLRFPNGMVGSAARANMKRGCARGLSMVRWIGVEPRSCGNARVHLVESRLHVWVDEREDGNACWDINR